VLRAVPLAVFAVLVLPAVGLGEWRLEAPASVASGFAFIASLVCALLLGCAITTLVNISLIWTISGEGVAMMTSAAVTFLSGMIIPLPLFPDWAQTILRNLPFAGLVDLPFRIYTGSIPADEIAIVMLRQLIWTGALVLFGRWLLARGMRALVTQGG
jgi:ABC-2 type transport system permease protein